MLPVFISYARRTSAAGARALHDALAGLAFLDERHLQPGEAFPAHIADALLGSRVAVVFADDAYFDSWYCRWELDAALQPYARAAAREEEPARQLDPLVVVLPPGHRSAGDLDRFPPEIQATHWNTADDIGAIVDLVRRRLERCSQTLAQRCVSLGQSPDTLRAELLERSAGADLPPAAGPIQRYPRQLPVSKGAGFVGRARDLWRIDHALGGARPAAALEGGGGVGKTQLALEYVHRLGPRRFPHGLYWIDADGDLEEQHHGILRTLAPDVPDLAAYRASRGQPGARTVRDDLSAALAGLAPGSRILFVVDNIPEPAAGERPRPLEWWCPSHDRVAVLTTSRARLGPSDGVHVLPVGVLERPPAIQLLAAGAPAGHRADDAGQVVEWVGRLPLALVLLNAAVRLGSTTVAELAAKAAEPVGQASELDEQMRVLEPLVPPGALRGIAQAFTLSYELLDAEARGAARLLARLAPAPIPVELIRELQLSRSARAVLTARSFVTAHDGAEAPVVPMFGAMHRVLADYLRSRSEEPAAEWTRACKALTAILARALRARDQWALQQAAVAHAQYVAGTQTPGAHVPEELPAALADVLARSFADLGMLEPALEAGDRAVAAYERLARERPIAFEPACALSLIALSTYLEALGRLEAADEAGERA
ncbi:MAG TPA: toll/interleukin-1 receptor domain-containing protein, partial [Myxococcaceae bacterium]|nr:toll/interleukin-1 receptor domain-containing protein [Myxococcaceae bacterium]